MDVKDGGITLTHDTVVLCFGDLRTLIGQRIERVADFELFGVRNKFLEELVIDPGLNVDARPSTAALAMIEARKGVSTLSTRKASAYKIP